MALSRLEILNLRSRVLKGNPLGDLAEREVSLYLPPGYDPARKYPALLALSGYMASGPMLFNLDGLGEDLKRKLDRLILTRKMPPVIVAAPDCLTRLAGNQHINSPAVGRYEDFLVKEVLPFVEKRHAVLRWGVFGKSSGGLGAMVLAMRHPKTFQAVAMHSGDAGFELGYLPFFAEALDRFREAGGPAKWLKRYWADPNRRRGRHVRVLDGLGLSAFYSADPKSLHLGIAFPFDLETGEFRPKVWARWRAWDPVNLVPRYAHNLKKLRKIYIDCGNHDECNFQWGARSLVKALRRRGLKPVYESFDDGHLGIAYRYDRSLPMLVRALA